MEFNFNPATSSPKTAAYDLAIIGGGIAGVAVARHAAQVGLSVILLERRYLAAGASSKSSRLIHGGIRYLETAADALFKGRAAEAWRNVRFVFAALAECRRLEKESPDLARPLPILIPAYQGDKRKLFWIAAGAYLYALLASLTGSSRWPRVFGAKTTLKKVPDLKAAGLRGSVLIWERLTQDADLTRRVASEARKSGAVILEHAPVLGFEKSQDGVFLIQMEEEKNNPGATYHAKSVVNASGPWIDAVRRRSNLTGADLIDPVAGAHIEVVDFLSVSLLLQAGDDRFFFCVRVGNGRIRVGTTERKIEDPDRVTPTDLEIEYLLDGLRDYFPGKNWDKKNILGSDAGTRPLYKDPIAGNLSVISREHHIVEEPGGAFHLTGVKLTDHRRAASETLTLIQKFLSRK